MISTPFARDVKEGLCASPKKLSSRYFYDANGDHLFQQIMHMPEYYLTDAEAEIFQKSGAAILDAIGSKDFDLVELGAGDGFKTRILLEQWQALGVRLKYLPIDISQNVLNVLTQNLLEQIPALNIQAIQGPYWEAIDQLPERPQTRVILFLGANIGNFEKNEAVRFLSTLRDTLRPGDKLLVGFDLKKDPQIILNAYNDPAGITAAFNLNLLCRINRELEANFQIDQFKHWETYNPLKGETRSFIISTCDQVVQIGKLDLTVSFAAWEAVSVELSLKYSLPDIQDLCERSGFRHCKDFLDHRRYFVDTLWEAI